MTTLNHVLRKILLAILVFVISGSVVAGYSIFDNLQSTENVNLTIGEWPWSIGISTPQEFYDFATSSTSTSDDYYHLENDIDFTGFTWDYNSTYDTNIFRGYFDGRGYTLSNITVTSTDTNSVHLSIFSQINGATIRNVSVENYTMGFSTTFFNSASLESSLFASNVTGTNNVIEKITLDNINIIANTLDGAGGLVTSVRAGADLTIRDIKATNVTVLNESKRSGGLISRAFNGAVGITIEDIDFEGNIASGNLTSNTGGLIGTMQDLPLTVSRVIVEYDATGTIQLSDGPITYTSGRYAGGFIGNNNNDDAAGNVFTDAFFTGSLYTQENRMGSAVGREKSKTTVLNNVYYSNVLFSTKYTPTSGTGLHSTVVNATSMPSVSWWNTFSTTFYSANSLWAQDASGRLYLIR